MQKFFIHKSNTCLQDSCGYYTLIIQHNYTKNIFVYKVRDRYFKRGIIPSDLLYYFSIPPLDEGQHTYYLCSYDGWVSDNVNANNVSASELTPYKPIKLASGLLNLNGSILVEKNSYIALTETLYLRTDIAQDCQELCPCEGTTASLYRSIEIIASGIVYGNINTLDNDMAFGIEKCCKELEGDNEAYIQYNG